MGVNRNWDDSRSEFVAQCFWHFTLEPLAMVSSGLQHTVLLRSDGTAVACGSNRFGKCNIPPLDKGVSYTQVSAGGDHTVLLRSDGTAVACGTNKNGQCNLLFLPEGMSYTQVSVGTFHTVLLRSDGCAVACGCDIFEERLIIPPLEEGMTYTQVSAGEDYAILLRRDGRAVACDSSLSARYRQCDMPPLEEGVSYTQVSAGQHHAVLLRSDGSAVAYATCGGYNPYGTIPPLDEGVCYTQVSAGNDYTVLLRSDGTAVACGSNRFGQCDIPPLDEGVSYTQVSAGGHHTVLLRSDGTAVACGTNKNGQCNIQSLKSWGEFFSFAPASCRYVPDCAPPRTERRVLQLDLKPEDDAVLLICSSLAGQEVLCLKVHGTDLAKEVHQEIARELKLKLQHLSVVLPDGQLLLSICSANPGATIVDVAEQCKCIT